MRKGKYYKYIKRKPRRQRDVLSATLTLILINFVFFIFVLSVMTKYPDFINLIAIKPSAIVQGKCLWTIFTNMFMHGFPTHLFVNMLSLFFIGSFLEKVIGKKRFLFLYLVGGIIAALFFVLLFALFEDPRLIVLSIFGIAGSKEQIIAVGASGAIFALAGTLVILTPNIPVLVMFVFPARLWVGILALLLILSFMPNVANSAHIGGFLFGLFMAYT